MRRVPLDLDLDDPDQKRLSDHLLKLAESGTASQWMRDVLVAAMPARSIVSGRQGGKILPVVRKDVLDEMFGETHYEDIQD